MAAARDAGSNSGYKASQSTYSWNHTCAGANRLLRVVIGLFTHAQSISSVTYNGVALSPVHGAGHGGGINSVSEYQLIAPATGTHSIAVTLSGSCDSAAIAESLTGIEPRGPREAIGVTIGDDGNNSDSIDTTTDGDWVVSAIVCDDTSISYTGDVALTERVNITGALGSLALASGGPVSPGSYALTWSLDTGGFDYFATLHSGLVQVQPAAVTRLGQFGVGLAAYGTFLPKSAAAPEHNPGVSTRLGQFGVGLARYGTFLPKTPASSGGATTSPLYPIATMVCNRGMMRG